MAQRPQPFRQVATDTVALERLQSSILEWIARQGAAEFFPLGSPTQLKSATYQAQHGDLVLCDASPGAFTVWLPPVSQRHVGSVVVVKDAVGSPNVVTVKPGDAAATIDGQAFVELDSRGCRRLVALSPTLWGEV